MNRIMYIYNDVINGGAGQSLLDMLAGLRNKIIPVVIMRDDVAAEMERKFINLGIQCYKIHFLTDYVKSGSASALDRELDIKQSYEAALRLLPIIESEKIQLIHINSSVSYFAAIAALMANIPYIWHIRELMDEHYGNEFLNEKLKISLYRKADRIISISNYVKQRYHEKYNVDSMRVYDGLNIRRFKNSIKPERRYKNVFLAVGYITPEKGQWDAILAIEILVKRGYKDIQLIMVGSGDSKYLWAIKKYIAREGLEKNISILPFQEELSELREKAYYAVTCSQSEALGRVTIEAMLAGNIVIGARSGGTVEVIGANEERGFLYELHDSVALADVMEKTMKYSDKTKNEMAEKAQLYAEETFDSKKYGNVLSELYDEVIRSYKPVYEEIFLKTIEEYYKSLNNSNICMEYKDIDAYRKCAPAFEVALRWLEIRQKGHSLGEYFKQYNIHEIAIYGIGPLGVRLYDELEGTEITVKYLIDKNHYNIDQMFEFVPADGEPIDVDAIVVTVLSEQEQIINRLKSEGYDVVVGLRDVLNDFEEKGLL